MKTVLYFRFQWRLCQRFAMGMDGYARKAGWRLLVVDNGPNMPSFAHAVRDWRADGCIIDWDFLGRAGWRPPVLRGVPTVYIDPPAPRGAPVRNGVVHDAASCARLAMDELLALDYPNYAFISYMENSSWAEARRREFERIVAAAGRRGTVFTASSWSGEAFYNEIRPWVAALPRPCGVFAANDKVAHLVIHACRLEGIPVPEAVAVVGVDDDEVLCEGASPALSSVRPDFEGAGCRAAELLDAAMADPGRAPEMLSYGSVSLVRRGSSRIFRRRDPAVRGAVEFVRLHACDGIAPADVLARMGGCRRTAEMRFREAAGRSIGEEIAAVRLARAKALLANPSVPIKVIAGACGYADPASLRKAFRKATGSSLGAVRLAQSAR